MVMSFKTEALNGLCSEDQLELLDAVDQLRLQGIDHYISLPQIIVCGDQSSGKSSVLEAISGVPFPVKSNLCTRFPTEVILRRSPHSDVTVSIIPYKSIDANNNNNNSNGNDAKSAPAFRETLNGFEGLSGLIESAQVAMGISMQGMSFSKDLLRIEITGPQHPHLTIVDLPGLIHTATKQQSAADVEVVQDVVTSYMQQPRSIILAVVSAKNDFANQIVLKIARVCDPDGRRSMGVITKPDVLVPGSDSEGIFVSLAKNKEFEFHLGWHVLRNLDSEQVPGSSLLRLRNDEEAKFFSEGVWKSLAPAMLGVKELRKRLSEVLLNQIATELPSLINEIGHSLKNCTARLVELGTPRVTVIEQKGCLLRASQQFQFLIGHAVNGTYLDLFFEGADTDTGYEQRLRAVIQNLNRQFSQEMVESGHSIVIDADADFEDEPNHISRDAFITKTQELIRRTRGRELPGRFDSMIVSDLFRKQSQPWRNIILRHMKRSWEAAKAAVILITSHIADETIRAPLLRDVINPAMNDVYKEVMSKADELIDSQKSCHPVTYNEQYLEAVHRVNDQRRREFCKSVLEEFGLSDPEEYFEGNVDVEHLLNRLSVRQETDDERFAASEAVDCMEAYYNVALKRMIDDIAIEVIERKLMTTLANVFSPMTVFSMSDDTIATIAGESKESSESRAKLSQQIEVLVKGSETCKRFAGVRLGDVNSDENLGEVETSEPRSRDPRWDALEFDVDDQPEKEPELSEFLPESKSDKKGDKTTKEKKKKKHARV